MFYTNSSSYTSKSFQVYTVCVGVWCELIGEHAQTNFNPFCEWLIITICRLSLGQL